MTIKKPKALIARIMALEQALDAERAKASKLQAELNQLHEAAAQPKTLMRYVGSPFGDFEVKETGHRQHSMLGMTLCTRETFVWQVVALDCNDPKEQKVTLKFVTRELANQQPTSPG